VGVAELRAPRREDPTLESLIGQQEPSSSSSGVLLPPSYRETQGGGLAHGECYANGKSAVVDKIR